MRVHERSSDVQFVHTSFFESKLFNESVPFHKTSLNDSITNHDLELRNFSLFLTLLYYFKQLYIEYKA